MALTIYYSPTRKLLGEREVYAQARLIFRSIVGEELVVTRSLQVTQKKGAKTLTMKTLDGSLAVKSDGERHVLSTRVAELGDVVPQKLGVSKAILENVIFCHQDESLWPLSEPAALKKKFDEIFEALRYTKAIDNLKTVRKRQQEALTNLKTLEAWHKENKEKGARVRKTLEALQAEIEELRQKGELLTAQMSQVEAQLKQKNQEANSFLTIVQDLENKRSQLKYKEENAAGLRATLKEMTESDEWLEDSLARYQQRIQSLDAEKTEKEAQLDRLRADLEAARESLGLKQAERGRLQSDKEKHERQLESRLTAIRNAARRLEIRGFDGPVTDKHVEAFRDRLDKMLQEKRREQDRLRAELAREHEEATAVISKQESRKAARVHERVSASQRIAAKEREAAKLQNTIQGLDVDEGALAVLQSAFADVEARLRQATQDANDPAVPQEIQRESDRLRQLEAEAEKLNLELVDCTRMASDRAQLDLRKKELAERKRKLDALTGTWRERLSAILAAAAADTGDAGAAAAAAAADWEPASVEADFQKALKKQNAAAQAAKRDVEATQQELKQVEYKLSSLRERRAKLTAESDRCRAAVLDALRAVKDSPDAVAALEDYQEELDQLEADILSLDKDISLFDHLKDYYTKSQTVLSRYNKCSLCERQFVDQPRERSRLLEKIARNLNDEAKRELERDRAVAEESLGRLRAVRSQYDSRARAEAELPALRADVAAAESQREALLRTLEDRDVAFKEADARRQDVESMARTVAGIAQAFRDVAESEVQTDRLASQQRQLSGVPARGAEDIQELQAACADGLRAVKARTAKLAADWQRAKDAVTKLELERSELKNELEHAARGKERKADLAAHVQAARAEVAEQRAAIQSVDAELLELEPRIAQARAAREEGQRRIRDRQKQAADEAAATEHAATELKVMDDEIADYARRKGAAALAASQRALEHLERDVAAMAARADDVAERVNALRAEAANGDRERKNMQDNLAYRATLRDVAGLRAAAADLASRNATDDHERLAAEARTLETRRGKLLAARGTAWGTMSSKDEELLRLADQWEAEYKDADDKFRETHIRYETTKAAIDDIRQYQAALDKAVMQYHALKMEEVNRIAGELWQATYQGTDIDAILIRSDAENGGVGGGAGGSAGAGAAAASASSAAVTERRTYNYRVCMVKQDTEMDMRGRCSAGQKVLASIIIRLALAESFGVNCGLIALDEPTTNLDVDNIRSLAASLHGIIKARQAQANFQLIVITHDEEFLRRMQCNDFCDSFYRVKRDDQQNSVISKESITRLIDG